MSSKPSEALPDALTAAEAPRGILTCSAYCRGKLDVRCGTNRRIRELRLGSRSPCGGLPQAAGFRATTHVATGHFAEFFDAAQCSGCHGARGTGVLRRPSPATT